MTFHYLSEDCSYHVVQHTFVTLEEVCLFSLQNSVIFYQAYLLSSAVNLDIYTHKTSWQNLHYCINILTFNMCTATKSIPNLSTKSKVGLLSNKVERASTVVMIRFFFLNQLAAIANFICNSLNKTQSRLEFSVDSLYDSRFQPRQSNKLKKI